MVSWLERWGDGILWGDGVLGYPRSYISVTLFLCFLAHTAAAPLVDTPAVDVGGPQRTTATTGVVGWTLPDNTQFLTQFLITITSTPRSTSRRRRRRQTGSTTITVIDPTSTESAIPLVPFSDNYVMVEAQYMLPGATAPVSALLVSPIVIQSLEGGQCGWVWALF